MTRGARDALLVAASLMAAGTVLPWGRVRTSPWNEVESVGGFDHGAMVVLVVAALLAAAALLRRVTAAVMAAGLAALVTACLAWELPGTLLSSVPGAYETGLGLGLGLSLLGAFTAFCAAAAIVGRALNDAALRSTARRAARA
ncbi:hypothetical protein [Baekduia sp. Peel2402]|uniref:hypothetical protein n=1 Tax=Baekduia sp. Peel2402 TaxID=3458296 RepID=UPI00403E74AA